MGGGRDLPVARVLVAVASADDRSTLRKVLEETGHFDRILEAAGGLHALRLILAEPIDVVVCDLELPQLEGEKLLRVLRVRPEGRNVDPSFLFLGAAADLERGVRVLEHGAHDVVARPYHAGEVAARVARLLRLRRLQSELLDKNAELSRLNSLDALTGLRTRRYVQELLAVEVLRAHRYGTSLTLQMVDLDGFKQLNDAHGHPAGDAVLRGVAERLLKMLRVSDTGGRWGGDELVVVMPQNTPHGAAVLAERWRAEVAAARFAGPDGSPIAVTLSIGIAEHSSDSTSAADLVAAADRALYAAKRQGRNRIAIDGK
jgi:diguanylate cyclase (GGDEF)-like protein